jgi:hypothetical protein
MQISRQDRDWREPIRKSEVATDYGISLARIQWDFFATMTFAGNVPRTQIAYDLASLVAGIGQRLWRPL